MNNLTNNKNHNNTSKHFLFIVIEYVLVFFLSYCIIRYFNRDVVIKALHLDDLHNLIEYMREPVLTNWILKYYETAMHYRPVFYVGLFSYFALIGTNVSRVLSINFVLCSILATVVYYLSRKLKIHRFLALLIVVLFSTINFLYYEIYQLIGFIEGYSMLFSLVILVLSIKLSYADDICFKRYSKLCLVFYLLLVFLHERYFPMLLLPLIATKVNKLVDKKDKRVFNILYYAELIFFFAIRYYHLRIIIPRGTDCTSLVDNFDLIRSFKFMYHQLMYLFGVNLGPEYLCGIDFVNTNDNIKIVIGTSAIIVLTIVSMYIYFKTKNKKTTDDKNALTTKDNNEFDIKHIDLFFILYIFLCILQSSLTIRVELRWLLASFVGLIIYLSHMLMYIFIELGFNSSNIFKRNIVFVIFLLFFSTRIVMNIYFKNNREKLFIINEQIVVNSLYENTVEKYGIEDIKNRTIYIATDYYRTIKPEELTHFFDQYDRIISDRQIIYLGTDFDNIDSDAKNKYDIVLNEIGNWKYGS